MSSQQFSRHGMPAPSGGTPQISPAAAAAAANLVAVNQPSSAQGKRLTAEYLDSPLVQKLVRERFASLFPPSRWWRNWRQPWCWTRAAGSPAGWRRWRGNGGVQRWQAGDHGGQTLPTGAGTCAATSYPASYSHPARPSGHCGCPSSPPPPGSTRCPHRGTDEGDYLKPSETVGSNRFCCHKKLPSVMRTCTGIILRFE